MKEGPALEDWNPGAVAARLALALEAAKAGGALALHHFHARDALVVEAKAAPQDVASRADREVEEMIRAMIAAAFPQDAVVGEENGSLSGTSGFTWFVDPIDGTSPFLAGLPHWCVTIAVVDDGATVAGVTVQPMTGDVFAARRGGGATLNGAPIRCDATKRIDDSLVAVGASHRTDPAHVGSVVEGLLRAGGAYYRNGSGALMLADVAAGRLGGYYEPHMHPWDCLAGLLMVEEAGGRTRPVRPEPKGGLVLAAAPGVWSALEAVVTAAKPDRER